MMRFVRWICAVAILLPGSPVAAETCRPLVGYFVSTFDAGPGCPDSTTTPPQCTHGKLYADEGRTELVATYEFSFTSQDLPAVEGERLLLPFEGTSIITENDGTVIRGVDDGELWPAPSERGQLEFQTRVHPFLECPPGEACRSLTSASSIVADGDLDLLTNTAAGTYSGQICW